MRIKIAVRLPRTAESVSVARQTLDRVFSSFGVRRDCREEIALAVSEACTNAVQHGVGEATYELEAESQDSECVITINDAGPGMTAPDHPAGMPAPDATGGRGVALMRLLTDEVHLGGRRSGGFSVRLFKRLRWNDEAFGSLPP